MAEGGGGSHWVLGIVLTPGHCLPGPAVEPFTVVIGDSVVSRLDMSSRDLLTLSSGSSKEL
jgi:hypothetical protein